MRATQASKSQPTLDGLIRRNAEVRDFLSNPFLLMYSCLYSQLLNSNPLMNQSLAVHKWALEISSPLAP